MKQYDDLNQGLKSLDQKFMLPEEEQSKLLSEINKKMNAPVKKRKSLQWKYHLASAVSILLIGLIALPLMNSDFNLVGGNHEETHGSKVNTPGTIDEKKEEITLNIVNQTSLDIYFMKIKIIKDGMIKHTQGGTVADDSPIEAGDHLDFIFYPNELGKGTYEIEIDFTNEPTNNSSQPPEHSSSRVLLEVSDQKDYTLELRGNSTDLTYLINPSIKSSNDPLGSLDDVKEQLILDLSKNEVEALFGENYHKVKSAFDEAEIWRYDFGAIGGYIYNEGYDHADIEGMQRGIIQAQLFVEWNTNNNVEAYTVLFLNSDERTIYFYELMPDGTERERVACGFDEEYGWNCPG
ncbi:hypothetical protein [Ornithinibacillus sp. 179-J 7C1 HS]|uniref:hypothetical protein n=1 Tax=Ornithinibacillus sp. 179-J 7C1 HS TaxID=3142384 RepID=UPI00399FAFF0